MLAAAPPAPVAELPPPLPLPRSAPSLPPVFAQAAPPLRAQTPADLGPPPAAGKLPAAARESLEMQIGTTWLVRAGIVLVLTSLAFLGSYLYYHVVPMLGPVAKVTLMYLGAAALAGIGAWLERSRLASENESLKNYARVVLAGGLASVYYVTYAAHWNPHLRVVSDPLLAGVLLLGWAAFMVWLADRRGSELLATFAILLAFYTSAINEISGFTLVSNLFLAGGAVYLLRRQLWQIFPFVSLLATFGSYGFWRFFPRLHRRIGADGRWPAAHRARLRRVLGRERIPLAVLAAVYLDGLHGGRAGAPSLAPGGIRHVQQRRVFSCWLPWSLLADYPGSFWKWSLGFGVALLVLAEASRRLLRSPAADTENAYLLQGVLLVTLGFIAYFSGWQLSLVLAAQSAVLLWRAGARASRALLGASCALASLSFLCALNRLNHFDLPGSWTVAGLAEGAFLIGNAGWSQRLLEKFRAGALAKDGKPSAFGAALVPAPAFFGFLGSAAWFWMVERQAAVAVEGALWLAGGALLLTASVYLLRVRALPWYAQVYLTAAIAQLVGGLRIPGPFPRDASSLERGSAFGDHPRRGPLVAVAADDRRRVASCGGGAWPVGTPCWRWPC